MQKNFSDSFLKKTIEVWQPRYGRPLTMEDAREIAFNTTALVKYLAKLNEKYNTESLKISPENT